MEVVAVLYRVKQFFRGIFASRLSKDEVDFVKENLPEAAWELFFQMNRADRRHSMHVLKTALELFNDGFRDTVFITSPFGRRGYHIDSVRYERSLVKDIDKRVMLG